MSLVIYLVVAFMFIIFFAMSLSSLEQHQK